MSKTKNSNNKQQIEQLELRPNEFFLKGSSDNVPFAWANPITLEKTKRPSKILKVMLKEQKERLASLPSIKVD